MSNSDTQDSWIDCGGPSWYLNNSILQSGPIENSGVSSVCRIVQGPATVRFWWKTDANHNGLGQVNFLVNNERKYTCDSSEGEYESIDLRYSGDYILTWEFIKYKSYPHYLGTAWLGEFEILDLNQMSSKASNKSSYKEMLMSLRNKFNTVYLDRYDDPVNGTFSSISLAQFALKEGGTIEAAEMNLTENIILFKPCTLIGSNSGNTNINKSGIYILSDNVTVKNLVIKGYKSGFFIHNKSYILLENNKITDCDFGVYQLSNCTFVKMNNNTIKNIKHFGVYMECSSNCIVANNTINNANVGIVEDIGCYNTFNNNIIDNVLCGIKFHGISENGTINKGDQINSTSCDVWKSDTLDVKNLSINGRYDEGPCPYDNNGKCKCINFY